MKYVLFGALVTLIMIAIGYLFSENKKAIKWKNVGITLLSQIAIIFFVVKVPVGQKVLAWAANGIQYILSLGYEGVEFVFGGLYSDNFYFAVSVLSLICFTSALISLLYYFKVIPICVKFVGKGISKLLGTTEVETFCAVGNSFLGATEAPLLTKPYLKHLTRSELFAVVVGGFSSIAVSVVMGYVAMGIDMKYILVAMITVPFSTMLMAKIIIPETKKNDIKVEDIETTSASNVFEAIGNGAIDGMHLAMNVGAVLIGFIGVVAVLNAILGAFGLSLAEILGVVLTPVAWIFGIPAEEVSTFSSLIGTKVAMNEYVAFSDLGGVLSNLSLRTQAILTIALANFANFSVIGITIGGFKAFCPEKAEEVSGFGAKALLAGVLTTLITAALVGMFI